MWDFNGQLDCDPWFGHLAGQNASMGILTDLWPRSTIWNKLWCTVFYQNPRVSHHSPHASTSLSHPLPCHPFTAFLSLQTREFGRCHDNTITSVIYFTWQWSECYVSLLTAHIYFSVQTFLCESQTDSGRSYSIVYTTKGHGSLWVKWYT